MYEYSFNVYGLTGSCTRAQARTLPYSYSYYLLYGRVGTLGARYGRCLPTLQTLQTGITDRWRVLRAVYHASGNMGIDPNCVPGLTHDAARS